MQYFRLGRYAKGGIHSSYCRVYDGLAWVVQLTARDPMIVFLISASILTLVTVTFLSGIGTSQGRRA
jgi:hypothetical protein